MLYADVFWRRTVLVVVVVVVVVVVTVYKRHSLCEVKFRIVCVVRLRTLRELVKVSSVK